MKNDTFAMKRDSVKIVGEVLYRVTDRIVRGIYIDTPRLYKFSWDELADLTYNAVLRKSKK